MTASVDIRTEKFMAQLRDHGNIETMFDILPDICFYIKIKTTNLCSATKLWLVFLI